MRSFAALSAAPAEVAEPRPGDDIVPRRGCGSGCWAIDQIVDGLSPKSVRIVDIARTRTAPGRVAATARARRGPAASGGLAG